MTTKSNTPRAKTPNARYQEWAIEQQKAKTVGNLLRVASAELPFDHDALDADPWLLNVENGTINLKTGELQPHKPEDHLTKLCPTLYDPEAKCELFLAFLDRIFAEDQELIQFVQKAVGYSITASVAEQVFFLLYGTGANGKSTCKRSGPLAGA